MAIYIIQPLKFKHIDQVSNIFMLELKVSILSLFGKGFIKKMFNLLMKENSGFIYRSNKNEEIEGFIFATKKDISLFRCITFSSLIFFTMNVLTNYTNLKFFLISFFKIYLKRSKFKQGKKIIELSHFAVKKNPEDEVLVLN